MVNVVRAQWMCSLIFDTLLYRCIYKHTGTHTHTHRYAYMCTIPHQRQPLITALIWTTRLLTLSISQSKYLREMFIFVQQWQQLWLWIRPLYTRICHCREKTRVRERVGKERKRAQEGERLLHWTQVWDLWFLVVIVYTHSCCCFWISWPFLSIVIFTCVCEYVWVCVCLFGLPQCPRYVMVGL